VKGDVVNDLIAVSEEPNVRIMETKALVCAVMPGRVRRLLSAKEQRCRGMTIEMGMA
jgi:hypothetical protein